MWAVCTDLIKPDVNGAQLFVVEPGAGLDLIELGLNGSLLPLVLAHLAQDGVFLVGLHINAGLARVIEGCRGRGCEGGSGGEPRCHLSMACQRLDASEHR